jgi:hypothetical protein
MFQCLCKTKFTILAVAFFDTHLISSYRLPPLNVDHLDVVGGLNPDLIMGTKSPQWNVNLSSIALLALCFVLCWWLV